MNRFIRPLAITLALLILVLAAACFAGSLSLHAADTQTETAAEENSGESIEKESSTDYTTIGKAFGAALAIALPAIAGAFAMGNAISKASESIARQPEADGKIRTVLMLGLVFIETVVIYALIAAILIIFVM